MAMLASIRVENYWRRFGWNGLVSAHFSAETSLGPLSSRWSDLFQEAPSRGASGDKAKRERLANLRERQ
jgi:hypothetical protein